MKRTTVAIAAVAVLGLAAGVAGVLDARKRREQEREAASQAAEIQSLEREIADLRTRLDALVPRDPRLAGMPKARARIGVPTTLMRELVEKTTAGLVDQVSLELRGIKVHKEGTIKKVVTMGQYALDVDLDRVRGRLRPGRPEVRFGGNSVAVSVPVDVVQGTGEATVHFTWDGGGMAGAVCGDLDITRKVSGSVKPARYVLSGSVRLGVTNGQILASPRFPETRLELQVEPSDESWAMLQAVLDEKKGLCGFVLGKVDVRKTVEQVVERGFKVRLPTERIKPLAVPVGFEPSLSVRGETLGLSVKVGQLVVTEHAFWLGADVSLASAPPAPAGKAPAGKAPAAVPAKP
jgi:hypothetical protein